MDYAHSDKSLAKAQGAPVEVTNDLWRFFQREFENNLDKIAVVSHHQPPEHLAWLTSNTSTDPKLPCLSWTYGQLLSAVDQVAHSLQACNTERATGLLTFIWNSVEYFIFFLAAIKLRMHFVPLDPRLLTRTTELESVFKAVDPGAVVVTDEEAARELEKSSQDSRPRCKAKVILKAPTSQQSPSGWCSLADLVLTYSSSPTQSNRPPGPETDIAVVLFTSGTTNRPKGAPHSIENCIAQSYSYRPRHIKAESRVLLHSPCFRAICYAWTISAWRQAACVVIAGEKPNPLTSLEAITMHKVTNMTVIPSVCIAMLEHQRFEELRPNTLEFLGFGGDVVMPPLLSRAKSKFQARIVRSTLGMTECTGFVGWEGDVSVEDIPTCQGFTAVGRPVAGATIKICEQDGRKILKKGEIGELHLGGQGVVKTYLEGRFPEAFYEQDGESWFKTGDRVVLDEDDVLYVLGRFKDVIKKSGLPISPTVLEGHLNNERGIKAQVVGMPHDFHGTVPVVVVKRISPDAPGDESLIKLITNTLGQEYSPQYVVSLGDLGYEDFPMNDQSKVLKSELQKRLAPIHEKKA
ncbi:MAG: hypothetical protein M1822_009359 [Bathelium mastoideum]|nr:MAG: hypothetical protein M1822_009359 [Bathelium mastoideum]